ncbi:DNA sulfur modification protein DndD [Bacillus sp. Y1]|nr:DNA sulfur modification protein DndD [Bacillus sp. Y1]AYA76014.1 DNA sulfur modification protein DndD [Bacillus sp. Y1]
MLFKKLIFDNYKTYYGHQEIDLYIPEDVREEEHKNLILLGGLNGAGKTTILKAIQYILFGKRGISEQEFKKQFSNVINNTFYNEGGRDCSISLTLETDRKEIWELKVKWSFDHLKRLINENRDITVWKPGARHGKHASVGNIDVFYRYIDKIIPFHASPFFIFDGEEIKDIILRQNSSEMKESIHKLTGMESYKQLLDDLHSIKSSLEKELSKSVSQTKLSGLNKELEQIDNDLNEVSTRKEKFAEEIKNTQNLIDEANRERNEKIIINSKSREVIIKKQSRLSTELNILNDEFNKNFKDHAISIILGNKIKSLKNTLKVEHDQRNQKILYEASLTPYKDFINQLLNKEINPPLSEKQLDQIKNLGEEIWIKENKLKEKALNDVIEEIHDLSSNEYSYLMNIAIKDSNFISSNLSKVEKLKNELGQIEVEIRNAPESVDISLENNKIDILTMKLGQLNLKNKSLLSKINTFKESRQAILNSLTRLNDQGTDFENVQLRLNYINKTITAIQQYVEEITQLKANFIKEEFARMLSKLFRKKEEFGRIEFDIETYSIRLYNDRLQEISIQDRSAGEMQMISSALIWALTKASNLSLPMVIDTPLGRLDSYHRNHLINNYYKDLSDQVIILSTDTEITEEYIDIMSKHSYKQYMLDYNEEKKYTVIRDGYFDFVKAGKHG